MNTKWVVCVVDAYHFCNMHTILIGGLSCIVNLQLLGRIGIISDRKII